MPKLSTWRKTVRELPGVVRARDIYLASHHDVTERLKPFTPNSAGHPGMRSNFSLDGPARLLSRLEEYHRTYRAPSALIEIKTASDFADQYCTASGPLERALADGFSRYGSDKASHDYHCVYAALLDKAGDHCAVLEVGLGTNNHAVMSNMGRSGHPGASLRAFRDALPGAEVFGADVDRDILFEEERIKTFFVDQTDHATVRELTASLPELDLVIDDGLHSPDANMAIAWLARSRVKQRGWFVVEDIPEYAVPLWLLLSEYLAADFDAQLVRAANSLMYVGQRRRPVNEILPGNSNQ